MLKQFILIYVGLIRLQEGTKLLNNARKNQVASSLTYLTVGLFILLLLLPIDFGFNLKLIPTIKEFGKFKVVIYITVFVLILQVLLRNCKFHKLNNYLVYLINIYDWKNSKERRIANFLILFYFVLYVPVIFIFTLVVVQLI